MWRGARARCAYIPAPIYIYIYIRGDIALRSPLIAKIEFRTGEESVDGMKDCGSSRKLMIGSFHKIFRCNEISSNQLSPIIYYLSPFPSLFTVLKNQTIEIRNLYSCKKKKYENVSIEIFHSRMNSKVSFRPVPPVRFA